MAISDYNENNINPPPSAPPAMQGGKGKGKGKGKCKKYNIRFV